ncbi:MAG: DNA cytosine methyltransferase [Acidobacteriaceae bacterium]|nr:DNA cytosine methyltransferase [Acidobacteriaceae bacterium]
MTTKTATRQPLVIDSFAGGGGASHGITRATGRSPHIAINHNRDAIEMLCNHGGKEFRGQSLNEPMATITASRDATGLVAPMLVRCAHGEGRWGKGSERVTAPLPTVLGSKDYALMTAFLARIGQTGSNGKHCNGASEPLTTIVSKNEHLLVCPTLIQTGYSERPGQKPRVPGLKKPLGTCVNGQKHALVVANLAYLNRGDGAVSATGNHAALVYSFLTKYNGTAIGQSLHEPLHTAPANDRFGLVTVTIHGEVFAIVDIGMRMLTPRELARAQGFPESYVLTGTLSSQVHRIGNSVPPDVAEAIVAANYPGASLQEVPA